jgi:hypothetical protein
MERIRYLIIISSDSRGDRVGGGCVCPEPASEYSLVPSHLRLPVIAVIVDSLESEMRQILFAGMSLWSFGVGREDVG